MDLRYTAKALKDKEIIKLLAGASNAVYSHAKGKTYDGYMHDRLKHVEKPTEVGWALYRAKVGKEKKKIHILAFRGTNLSKNEGKITLDKITLVNAKQDWSFAKGSGKTFKRAFQACVNLAQDLKMKTGVDYICGHSLGGIIAECVSDATLLSGASFANPGPYPALTPKFATGTANKTNVKWCCILNVDDIVPFQGNKGGSGRACDSHILEPAKILLLSFRPENSRIKAHKISNYCLELEKKL